MFDSWQDGSADAPLFWLELFDHHGQASVDSQGCHEITDAVAVFEDFISQAQSLNDSSPPEGNETQR